MKKQYSIMLRVFCIALSLVLMVGAFSGCKNSSDEDEYSIYTSVIQHVVDGDGNKVNDTNSTATGNKNDKTSSTGSSSDKTSGNSSTVETREKTFTIVSSLLPDRNNKNKTVFEQMFYKRVEEVEKEHNVKIKVINTMGCDAAQMAPLIQAGKMVGNICEIEVRYLPALVAAGYAVPWDNVKGVDVNSPNFTAGYTKAATIKNKHYGLQFMKPPEVRYTVVMNKSLLKKAGIDADNIYDLIKNKKWNYDTLLDYAKKVTNAEKGIYGVGGNPEYLMEMLMSGNNANIVTFNSAGKASPTYTSKNVVEALNFMNQLINVDKVYKKISTMSSKAGFAAPDYISEFVQGRCAFLFEDSWVLNQKIRPKVKNFDYGMISVPLGPSGTKYVSSSGHARVFYITSTNKHLDFTAQIFNALSEAPSGYEGNQWWKDEIALDYFQNGDSKSLDIYLNSLDNMSFDYGLGMDNVFDGFKDAAFGSIFWNSGKTPSAALESIKGNYDSAINDFFNK